MLETIQHIDKEPSRARVRRERAGIERLHHQNNFDLLRLLAALLVVIGHMNYTYFGKPSDWFSWLSGIQHGAFLGVGIFFAISGYLVTQSRWRSNSIVSFAWKRALRIFPALIVCVLVLAVIVYPFTSLSLADYAISKDMLGFLLNIFIFPYNNCVAPIATDYVTGCNLTGATWSLIFEVLLYAMIGVLGFAGRATQLRLLAIAYIIFLIIFMHNAIDQAREYNLTVHGISLFYIHNRGFPFVALFIGGALLNFVPQAVLKNSKTLFVAAAIYVGSFNTTPIIYETVQTVALPFLVVGLGLLRFRVADIVDTTGDLSYAIYLYHFPIMALVWISLHQVVSAATMTAVAFAVIFAVAYASVHWIERPSLNSVRSQTLEAL